MKPILRLSLLMIVFMATSTTAFAANGPKQADGSSSLPPIEVREDNKHLFEAALATLRDVIAKTDPELSVRVAKHREELLLALSKRVRPCCLPAPNVPPPMPIAPMPIDREEEAAPAPPVEDKVAEPDTAQAPAPAPMVVETALDELTPSAADVFPNAVEQAAAPTKWDELNTAVRQIKTALKSFGIWADPADDDVLRQEIAALRQEVRELRRKLPPSPE